MKKLAILLGIFLFMLPFTAQATQPQQAYSKIYISPFYLPSMTGSGVSQPNYTFSVSVNPPDGLGNVVNAMINFQIYIIPTVTYTLYVNDKPCRNPNFSISTTFASQGMAYISFDCSNVITRQGNYTLKLSANKDSSATYGWLDLTYMNNPNPAITISGTEYQVGDNATVFLQLLNSTNQAVNNALCYLKTYYPNKTVLFNNVNMPYFIGSDGLYYYDFVVPNTAGVYMLSANCNFYNNLTYRTGENDTYVNSGANTTNYGNLTYFNIGRNGNTTFYYGYVQFNMTNLTAGGLTSVELYLFQTLGLVNRPIVTAQRVTSFWNESNVTWNTKPTNDAYVYDRKEMDAGGWYKWNITGLAQGWINGSYANYGVFFNISPSTGTLNYTYLQAKESAGAYMPYLLIQYYSNEQVNEIRGSGEVHVSVLNITTNINQNQFDSILTAIASVNQTLNTTILNYLVMINGTTFQINQSLYQDYLSLLSAINSVNATATANQNLLTALNGSLANLTASELSHYNSIISFLASINTTINTTLEYKLDLINGTVMQINQSQTAYYLSLWGAIESVGATLNGTITQYLVVINDTTYNLSVNEYNHYLSVLQAISSVNSSVNSLNLSQYQDYLSLYNLLVQINQTGNTTLEIVASINQSLLSDYISLYNLLYSVSGDVQNLNASEYQHFQELYVILTDLNYTTNTTLENKLDLINYTTWQSWMILQNLTVGNLTVFASINWTEGIPYIWNATGQAQINYSLLSLSQQGIQLIVETTACVNNSTLMHYLNVTNCVFGNCLSNMNQIPEYCARGCANNVCIPEPTVQYFTMLGVLLLIAGAMYFAWRASK